MSKQGKRADGEDQVKRYKHTFRLNEQENKEFSAMLKRYGYEENKSLFITKRIFFEAVKVRHIDPTAVEFLARLNDLLYEFNRVGNNYNQIVKQVNTHFAEKDVPHQLTALIGYTKQLKRISESIVLLCKELKAWLDE